MRETSAGRLVTTRSLPAILAAAEPVSLPAGASSAASARRVVRDTLGPHLAADVGHTLELLTSELVTNAVSYARDRCTLQLSVPRPDVVRVAVADGDHTLPQICQPGPVAERGRGLLLVEMLAVRWGAERSAEGKVVWFELAV